MPYLIMTSSAKVKGKAKLFGIYRNVAVVEWDGRTYPKMISERARGVRRIVRHYGSQFVGKTSKCQYQVCLREAEKFIGELTNA